VLIAWQTEYEVDNLGFHVYREQAGERVRLTPGLVAGSALLVDARTELVAGHSYAWWDEPGPRLVGEDYWLEELDLDGSRRWHGPVVVRDALPGDPTPRVRRSVRLAGLGASGPGVLREGAVWSGGEGEASVTASSGAAQPGEAALGGSTSARVPRRRLEQVAGQWAVAGASVVKFGVNAPGWYRAGRDELVAAGLDPSVDPRWLQLFADGAEVPIRVVGEEDSVFSSGDALEWYGQGQDTPTTDTRVYYLVAGMNRGRRIEVVAAGSGGSGGPPSFPYEVVRDYNSVYFAALKNGELDNFFGPVIAGEVVNQGLDVHHLDFSGEASLEVRLQGATAGPHRLGVRLNGKFLGLVEWQDQLSGQGSFQVPAGALREGQTILAFEPLGLEGDVSLIERVTLRYPHTYEADGRVLTCTVPGGSGVVLSGFGSGAVRVIDVTDGDHPRELAGSFVGSAVSVIVPGEGTRKVIAFSEGRQPSPAWVKADQSSSLWATHGADLVVVGAGEFLPAVEPLVDLRRSEGLQVLVADVEDVVDEFGAGAWGPQPLQQFLRHAATSWPHPPRYVLLVGDATFDPRDYTGSGGRDFVPTRLVDTEYLETASDEWLSDFDADGLADLALGRLPVSTVEEATVVVGKIVAYERQPPAGRVLLVSDLNEEGNEFELAVRRLQECVPPGIPVTTLYRSMLGSEGTHAHLVEELGRGATVLNYVGHGTVETWNGNVLTAAQAAGLTSRLTVGLLMTCLNGFFQDPGADSLAEALLKAPAGGAVAVWASSGLTMMAPQSVMNQDLFHRLFASGETPRLGDALRAAKAATDDPDVRATWVLLGDPTTRVH
jgi:hypothetical protein